MDKRAIFLSVGMVELSLSYVLFTNQQYFSLLATLGVFAIALIGALLLILPHMYKDGKEKKHLDILLSAISLISIFLIFFELNFNLLPPGFIPAVLRIFLLVAFASGISVIGVYLLSLATKSLKSYQYYISALFGVLVIAAIAYLAMYGVQNVSWSGVDEVLYNYYASFLFVHGTNPYTASMQPIANQYGVAPTIRVNGTYVYSYGYPAFSFIAFSFIPALGITSFLSYIAVVIFIAVSASFLIYKKSDQNNFVLIPLFVWFVITYSLIGTATQYLAIAGLLLIAYLERHRFVMSSLLLGISASTIQLSWFAIPFFFVLIFRENGWNTLIKSFLIAIATFLVINSYFIAISPNATITNLFEPLGVAKLVVYGPNIMQFFSSFYSIPYWYTALLSLSLYFLLLALFYLYTDTLRPFLAVIPATIFFFAWRNISIYGIPYMALVITLYFAVDKKENVKDILKKKELIAYALFAFTAVFVILGVFVHNSYASTAILKINNIIPIVFRSNISSPSSLGALRINVANNGNATETVTFYIVSRSPNNNAYFIGSQLNSLQAHSSLNYTFNYQLPLINNSTKIFVLAFSKDYSTSNELDISLR